MMLETRRLCKVFWHTGADGRRTEKRAVDDVSLSVGAGEIFGLLGPNGAGKTTLIRMLTMLARPTSGEIWYDGRRADGAAGMRDVKRMIGVVPQSLNFDQDLTAGENLELHARLYGLGRAERASRVAELLEYVGLSAVARDGVRKLSGGMKRRLLIARALIHRPRVLFLDEPTVALDPQVRRRIWEQIRRMAEEGATVFLTTHYIEEAEALCGRVAVMDCGRLLAVDTPRAFVARAGRFAVEWRDGARRASRLFPSREAAGAFLATLEEGSIRAANLEDAFIEMTGRREGL